MRNIYWYSKYWLGLLYAKIISLRMWCTVAKGGFASEIYTTYPARPLRSYIVCYNIMQITGLLSYHKRPQMDNGRILCWQSKAETELHCASTCTWWEKGWSVIGDLQLLNQLFPLQPAWRGPTNILPWLFHYGAHSNKRLIESGLAPLFTEYENSFHIIHSL